MYTHFEGLLVMNISVAGFHIPETSIFRLKIGLHIHLFSSNI